MEEQKSIIIFDGSIKIEFKDLLIIIYHNKCYNRNKK